MWVLRQPIGLRLDLFIEPDSGIRIILGDVVELVVSLTAGFFKGSSQKTENKAR